MTRSPRGKLAVALVERAGFLKATIPPQPYLMRARSWPQVMPTVGWLAIAIGQCGTTGHVVMVEKGNVQLLRIPPQELVDRSASRRRGRRWRLLCESRRACSRPF